jgi:hypothetical protein
MIEPAILWDVVQRPSRTGLGIGSAIDDPVEA